jgi:spoIIIJ-associated protein
MSWFFKSKPNKKDKNGVSTEADAKNQEPVEILNKLLSMMDCKATIAQDVDEAENIILNISTDEAGRIIGEKGETLYSLQFLVNKILYTKNMDSPKIIIDVDHYRSKRKEKLIEMGQMAAESARKSGKASCLPPLNAYERKIVHESLQDDNDVDTKSEGEGYYKKIFVSLIK